MDLSTQPPKFQTEFSARVTFGACCCVPAPAKERRKFRFRLSTHRIPVHCHQGMQRGRGSIRGLAMEGVALITSSSCVRGSRYPHLFGCGEISNLSEPASPPLDTGREQIKKRCHEDFPLFDCYPAGMSCDREKCRQKPASLEAKIMHAGLWPVTMIPRSPGTGRYTAKWKFL